VAKQKTRQSDDFLIGGYIPGRNGVDELVVGERRGREFYFVASVKNGFVPATRQRIYQAIKGREINHVLSSICREKGERTGWAARR
jgi:ATP-dependent DNA ligase